MTPEGRAASPVESHPSTKKATNNHLLVALFFVHSGLNMIVISATPTGGQSSRVFSDFSSDTPPLARLRESPFAGEEELRNARRSGFASVAMGGTTQLHIDFRCSGRRVCADFTAENAVRPQNSRLFSDFSSETADCRGEAAELCCARRALRSSSRSASAVQRSCVSHGAAGSRDLPASTARQKRRRWEVTQRLGAAAEQLRCRKSRPGAACD